MIIIIKKKARDKPWKKFVVLKFWRKSHDSWGLDNHSTSMHALTYTIGEQNEQLQYEYLSWFVIIIDSS